MSGRTLQPITVTPTPAPPAMNARSTHLTADLAGDRPSSKRLSRHVPAVARILLGLPFAIFGLNAFLNFIPPPTTPLPEEAMAFAGALMKSGYMMPLIGLTQSIVGVLLVTNRFVPLALALLAPFLVNALAFHVFLERSGLPLTLVFAALELYLAWAYRAAYRPLFAARAVAG
jgi:hypothetical protein